MAIHRKLLVGTLWGLTVFGPARAAWGEPAPRLAVLVYNFSDATPELLRAAEREAGRIFTQSGVHIAWTDCPIEKTPAAKSECNDEPAPGQIRLRILRRPSTDIFRDSILGFAIAPVFASIYYDSAVLLARTSINGDIDLSVVLGCLASHEIGHLLLGENRHSASGIMKAEWLSRQVQLAMMGSLLFLPEESMLLNAKARERESKAAAARSGSMVENSVSPSW